MGAANKLVTGLILFCKNETTYGAGMTLAGASDAIQLAQDFPVFNIEYGFDGSRKGAQYSGGNLQRVGPSGATIKGKVKLEAKGSGSAYTATAQVPNIHPFLLAGGMSCSFAGVTNVYKPVPLGTALESLAMECFDRGEKIPISGAVATWTLGATDSGPSYFEFDLSGLPGTPADLATPPTRTFKSHTILPPKNEAIALTIGSFTTGVVRNWSYDHAIEVAPRTNVNAASGHNGFALGRRVPVFKCTVEADALSTYNPYSDYSAGTPRAISLTVGVATNGYTVSLPIAQLTSVQKEADGPVAMWSLTFSPVVSSPDASDEISISFI